MDQETDLVVDDLEALDGDDESDLGDGWIRPPITWSCPQ